MGILVKNKTTGNYEDISGLRRYDPAAGAYREADRALVQDGEAWREVWPGKTYLIKDGTDRTAGGWRWIQLVGTPSASWAPGCLVLANTYGNGSTNWYLTNAPVNLEGKSRLCITMDAQGPGGVSRRIGLFNSNTFTANNEVGIFYASHMFSYAFAKTTVCIEFNPASGKYVGFGVGVINGTTTYRIYDVWME